MSQAEFPQASPSAAMDFERSLAPFFRSQPLLSLHAHFAFEMIEPIGEGGMGEVFMIRDQRLGRFAALKLMNYKASQDPAQRERFLREAKVTAQLDHPAIPPVFEAGQTTKGELYLLMRLIRGQTLKKVLAECLLEETLQGRRTELLEALSRVGEALAYAHQKGILHRDLKPDNIMVGDFGEVLVMDWGLAKDLNGGPESAEPISDSFLSNDELLELGEVGLTVAGSIVGTPGYMSPEQFEGGDIDGRSDVFALGLLLSEVLTGQPALSGESNVDLLAKTASGAAKLPRDLDSTVPRELNWIAEQALNVYADRRTESVPLFVSQLKAFLAGEPVPGYRYSLRERTMAVVRSRPGWVITFVALMLILGLMVSFWLSLEREWERSERLSLMNQLAISQETKRREIAEKRVGQAQWQADQEAKKAKRAEFVLESFNNARVLVRRGSPQVLILEQIEKALVAAGRSESALIEAAEICKLGGLLDDSKRLFVEVTERYPPSYPALFALHNLELDQRSRNSKSGLRKFAATRYFHKIVSEAEKRGDENEFVLAMQADALFDQGRTRESIKLYDKIESYSTTFALGYNNRGKAYEALGELEKALEDYTRAISINPNYPLVHCARGSLYLSMKRPTEALVDFNKAIELKPDFAFAYYKRGTVLYTRGLTVEALSSLEKAIELDPSQPNFHFNLGWVYIDLKRYNEALSSFEIAEGNERERERVFHARGVVFHRLGKFKKALACFNQSLLLNSKYALAFEDRALLFADLREFQRALVDHEQAIKLNPKSASAYRNRGMTYYSLRRNGAALQDFNKAIELNPNDVKSYLGRAQNFSQMKDYEKAFKDYSRVLELDPKNYKAYNSRGIDLCLLNRRDEAILNFNKAIELSPNVAVVYRNRGLVHRYKGRYKLALKDFDRCLQLSSDKGRILYLKGTVFLLMQDNLRARKAFEMVLRDYPKHPVAKAAQQALDQLAGKK